MTRYSITAAMPFLALMALSTDARSDQVIADDQLIQGDLCIGTDCVYDIAFPHRGIQLKAINTRIRLTDSSATTTQASEAAPGYTVTGQIGNSWRINANESVYQGVNHFMVLLTSVETSLRLSDGTAPQYDCSVYPPVVSGTLPVGAPLQIEATTLEECNLLPGVLVQQNGLRFGSDVPTATPPVTGGIAIGSTAEVVEATVSVGSAELMRRLANVAKALADTDALPKADMNLSLTEQQNRLTALTNNITALELEMTALEADIVLAQQPKDSEESSDNEELTNNDKSSSSGGALWLLLMAFPLFFRARAKGRLAA